jgi:hypothetical protein
MVNTAGTFLLLIYAVASKSWMAKSQKTDRVRELFVASPGPPRQQAREKKKKKDTPAMITFSSFFLSFSSFFSFKYRRNPSPHQI